MSIGSAREKEKATYTSEVERTLKCRGEKHQPYIPQGMVCAHIVSGTRVATENNKVQRDWTNKSGATIK